MDRSDSHLPSMVGGQLNPLCHVEYDGQRKRLPALGGDGPRAIGLAYQVGTCHQWLAAQRTVDIDTLHRRLGGLAPFSALGWAGRAHAHICVGHSLGCARSVRLALGAGNQGQTGRQTKACGAAAQK